MKIVRLLQSRTIWMFIGLVVINGVPAVKDMIPATALPYVDVILGLLGSYFRARPRVEF